jgi:hypothetical protein
MTVPPSRPAGKHQPQPHPKARHAAAPASDTHYAEAKGAARSTSQYGGPRRLVPGAADAAGGTQVLSVQGQKLLCNEVPPFPVASIEAAKVSGLTQEQVCLLCIRSKSGVCFNK